MKITLTNVLVDDQAKALDFYTYVLGFKKKTDEPVGQHRCLNGLAAGCSSGSRRSSTPLGSSGATTVSQRC